MWWWTVFLCLIFYGHTSSQPVTDDSENARQVRQLDFGECCPCPGSGSSFAAQESSMPSGDGLFARARDIDDCPCRDRSSDSEGASSIFFPTSMRSDENFVRPADKKDDFKPLLHPEVDLASSVLETLREATDEEYQDALARDAARSMAKAAEESVFGDALPEASTGNIVTIIVNPKHTDSFEDGIPQESHVQESRCIHTPLENRSPNLGQMRVAQKPSLLRELFGLPRKSKPVGLLHENLLDMDNGASNIQERVVQSSDNRETNKSIPDLKKYAPLMKFDKNIKDKSTNTKSSVDFDTKVKTVPDFKLPAFKLKDLISNKSALEGKEKTNFPSIPKMKLNNPFLKEKESTNKDLNLSPSNIHEQAKKNFFQTKSHLENILQKSRPVNLKTLLKLKDVEFVPLKDLIPKTAESPTLNKPKFAWPDIYNKRDRMISGDKSKYPMNVAKTTEIIEKIPERRDESFDAEGSASNIIEQNTNDDCKNGAFIPTETSDENNVAKIASTEVIDAASSPTEIEEIISNTSNHFANSLSNEIPNKTDDCNISALPVTETDIPQSIESTSENVSHINNDDKLNLEASKEITPESDEIKQEDDPEYEFISNDEDCVNNINDGDSITDTSNNINDVLKPNDGIRENDVDDALENKTPETEEPCSQELPVSDASKIQEMNPRKLIKPLSLDKTLSSIKEKITKHIEGLKNTKSSSKILDRQSPSNIIENKEPSFNEDEKQNSDCEKEEPIQITTAKPDSCNDDLGVENEPSDKVSMQDLQKISDEMLQEEQERETKTLNCNEPTHEEADPKEPIVVNDEDIEDVDLDQSANTQNEAIINNNHKNDDVVKNTCDLPKQSLEPELDANVEASEIVINRIPESSDIFGKPLLLNKVLQPNENDFSLLNSPISDIDGIKLEPLPTLDEIKLSFTNLLENPGQNVVEHLASEAASMTDTANVLAPIMSTDSSTKHFQLKLPPLTLEDLDLDILQLKPPSNIFSKIPNLDLHSFRTKLPLPTDLRIKPIKLQSAFEDNGGLLGASLSLGEKKPWETIPSLDNIGNRMKANTQKIAKSLRKPDALRHSQKSSKRIGELSDTKSTLKGMPHSLESKFRGATTKPVNLQNNDLLEAITRNHEDVSDKLRALHIDFTDRLETMRNNLFDTSIFGSGESRSTKSFSAFSNKNKDKKLSLKTSQPQSLTSRRESKKTLKPRRFEQLAESRLQNKFKMPTAASVPVPKTVAVPELKATPAKSPGLGVQRASGINPMFQNKDASQPKESQITLWKQASKKLPITNTRLVKTNNPFKDSTVKVSFSTTPRPALPRRLQSRKLSSPSLTSNLGKNTGGFGQRLDHNGSPSEMKHSVVSPPISSHLDTDNQENYVLKSESRQTGASLDLPSRKFGDRKNLDQPTMSKDLQAWPRVSESAFLSKVKEAVKARMSKINSSTLKQADTQSGISSLGDNGETRNLNTDMARSASTNIDVIDGEALKENVSYKCTMVCTKE